MAKAQKLQQRSSFSELLKDAIRPTYHKVRWLLQHLRGFSPSLPVSSAKYKLVKLGTDYGGWTFVDADNLKNATIVSCGLGEDASFDIEFAAKYDAKIVMVDPTPRAIAHYKGIISRVGEKDAEPYTRTGAQPITAYDLSKIRSDHLMLCEKALWNKNTQLRFFLPKNPLHVSHSIINYQNNYSTSTDYIEVEAITLDQLLNEYGIANPTLIKIDIEGAEIEVLDDMISKKIFPTQLLVEYDELSVPTTKSKNRIEAAHQSLLTIGYTLIHREHTNFLYVHRSLTSPSSL